MKTIIEKNLEPLFREIDRLKLRIEQLERKNVYHSTKRAHYINAADYYTLKEQYMEAQNIISVYQQRLALYEGYPQVAQK